MKASDRATLFSSNLLLWGTPPDTWQELKAEFPFELDAATTQDNPLQTPHFYTPAENGLEMPWLNWTYCNPPYGRNVGLWLVKAQIERLKGISSVFLLPVRTDTRWFHDCIYKKPFAEIRFIKGRLRFVGTNYQAPSSAPFPSMIVVFRPLQK